MNAQSPVQGGSAPAKGRLGIIVSGGPAPGINCVISSATIEAVNRGYEVIGFNNGFKDAGHGAATAIVPLSIDRVSRIYNTGGSILGTSRFNPFLVPEQQERFCSLVKEQNIDKLIIIGGEGSAYLSVQVAKACPGVRVVSVPKTIDNDLVLPHHHPSFGFETARSAGMKIIDTLMVDAKTTRRWFMVTSMGRKAGFLALGLGIASGATLTLIPEEFGENERPTPQSLAGIIFASIKKRWAQGKEYGVAILAEGILDCLNPDSSFTLKNVPRDEIGRIRYADIELGDVILPHLRLMCKQAAIDIKIIPKNIGYELRCHAPTAFDIDYCKFLGYGAVKLIEDGHSGVMVTREFDRIGFLKLSEMQRDDGTIVSRQVDLTSDLYLGARSFMIR